MPTILLCDDHQLFREGLAALLLQRQPTWQVVGQAGSGEEAVRLAEALGPEVAILDLAMPGMDGIEAAKRIRERSPQTRIVALSMYGDPHYRRRMLAAGASAYVLKNEAGADLMAAIEAVLRGETFVSPSLAASAGQPSTGREGGRSAQMDYATLTGREREVLRLLAQGRRTREIALTLGISAKTV
ncbi:MAG: response regulator transcription factor [Chromatiaceae bacterium]|jgi:DNA-binding NarL/FixJ family response regulator|nr:response regulator transcription factor [Chromatiaceae bacterium]